MSNEQETLKYLSAMGVIDFNKLGFVYGKETITEVLNLLKKKADKINKLKKQNKLASKEHEERFNEFEAEIEKKDKIIDLMSRYIYKREDSTVNIGRIYCPEKDCDDINREVNCDTCIKQYFERKVEG